MKILGIDEIVAALLGEPLVLGEGQAIESPEEEFEGEQQDIGRSVRQQQSQTRKGPPTRTRVRAAPRARQGALPTGLRVAVRHLGPLLLRPKRGVPGNGPRPGRNGQDEDQSGADGKHRVQHRRSSASGARSIHSCLARGLGRPLVIVEGEFDALLLGQELRDLAAVVTLGSASSRPDLATRSEMLAAAPWFIATVADEAASGRPAVARRVRPPGVFKDWTEAAQAGVNLRRCGRIASGEPRPRPCSRGPSWPPSAGDRPETIPALKSSEAGPIEAASRQGEVSDRCDAQLPDIEVFTVPNVLLMLVPSVVTIPMQATRIRASMTAYSTAVGPSSLARNRDTKGTRRDMVLVLQEDLRSESPRRLEKREPEWVRAFSQDYFDCPEWVTAKSD